MTLSFSLATFCWPNSLFAFSFSLVQGWRTYLLSGSLCQLPLSKRAAQLFSHTMKLVKNEKIVNQQKQITNDSNTCWSHLNASRAARNCFVDRMFVTPDLVSHAHPSQEGSWVNPVFPNHFRLRAPHRIQITCGTQWRTHSNFLKNSLSPACTTFLVKLCNPITRQAIELESSSNPLRIQQVL